MWSSGPPVLDGAMDPASETPRELVADVIVESVGVGKPLTATRSTSKTERARSPTSNRGGYSPRTDCSTRSSIFSSCAVSAPSAIFAISPSMTVSR